MITEQPLEVLREFVAVYVDHVVIADVLEVPHLAFPAGKLLRRRLVDLALPRVGHALEALGRYLSIALGVGPAKGTARTARVAVTVDVVGGRVARAARTRGAWVRRVVEAQVDLLLLLLLLLLLSGLLETRYSDGRRIALIY